VESIPAIPNAQNVPSLLCHERFNEAGLSGYRLSYLNVIQSLKKKPIQYYASF
jgi:hypothetical protein